MCQLGSKLGSLVLREEKKAEAARKLGADGGIWRKGGKVTGNCSELRYGELCDFVRLAKCYLGDQFKEE